MPRTGLAAMFIPPQFGVGQGDADTHANHEFAMRLFSFDLFRNFGIGFVFGALLLVGANAENWDGAVASPAQAAELSRAPAPDAEFVIAPLEG
jgi:hypothetical protein